MRRPMLAATMLLTFLGTAALAQSAADHGAHHPDQKDAPAVGPVTPAGGTAQHRPVSGQDGRQYADARHDAHDGHDASVRHRLHGRRGWAACRCKASEHAGRELDVNQL